MMALRWRLGWRRRQAPLLRRRDCAPLALRLDGLCDDADGGDDMTTKHGDLRRGVWLDDVEQHGDPGSAEQGTSDEPQHGHAAWHQARPVYQVAQDQPIPDADNEARPEQERPIMDRDERSADR